MHRNAELFKAQKKGDSKFLSFSRYLCHWAEFREKPLAAEVTFPVQKDHLALTAAFQKSE